MNRIKIFTFLLCVISAITSYSQITDSSRIDNLEITTKTLKDNTRVLQKQIVSLQQKLAIVQQETSFLSSQLSLTDSTIASVDSNYSQRLQQTNDALSSNENKQQKSIVWGIVIAVLLAIITLLTFVLLRKRISKKDDDIASLRERADAFNQRADELNQKIVERMDKELEELQKISQQATSTQSNTNSEPDHSLVKALADRITFMEMTLYRMDSSVKGHKQLSKSIKNMKDNLLANGYEIVDMLGKDYVEGMKASPSFVDDENLAIGKRIITGITKPQINYKGIMIQAAQITVSQNI